MVLHETRTTIITCVSATHIGYMDEGYTTKIRISLYGYGRSPYMSHWPLILHVHVALILWNVTLVFHIHLPLIYTCTTHGYLLHRPHCYRCLPHECTCLYSFYLLVIWLTVHVTPIIVPCYRIHVIWLFPVIDTDFPLLDMRAVDMRYVGIPHLLFPFLDILFMISCSCYIVPDSRYIVLRYQQSSGPVIVLTVPCTVICSCYIGYWTYQIIMITGVWGRLDGWLDLIGWCTGSILFSHCRGR